jgi:hypothetical protein
MPTKHKNSHKNYSIKSMACLAMINLAFQIDTLRPKSKHYICARLLAPVEDAGAIN